MKKLFSKKTLSVVAITYILLVIVYFIGYNLPSSGGSSGIINLGPEFGAMVLTIIAFPIIIVGSLIYIGIKVRPIKYAIIGYLLLTVGVVAIFNVSDGIYANYQRNIGIEEAEKRLSEEEKIIKNAIGSDILHVYPNAEFEYVLSGEATVVKLGGYKYQNQPNFDEEISRWKELKEKPAIKNYKNRIMVQYYFENTEKFFARIHISDFTLYYSSLGMSEEGLVLLKSIMQTYLKEYYNSYDINYDYGFKVTIYKKLNSSDEKEAAKIWQNFIEINNINKEIVDITVTYNEPNTYNSRYYDVRQESWY